MSDGHKAVTPCVRSSYGRSCSSVVASLTHQVDPSILGRYCLSLLYILDYPHISYIQFSLHICHCPGKTTGKKRSEGRGSNWRFELGALALAECRERKEEQRICAKAHTGAGGCPWRSEQENLSNLTCIP